MTALAIVLAVFVVLLVVSLVALVRDLRADGYGSSHTSGTGLQVSHRLSAVSPFTGPGLR